MATNTDVPIYATTLSTSASSVTIDLSAYQQYANLKIVVTGRDSRTETNDGYGLTFNSDNSTGSTNYSDTFMYAANATTYSGRNSNYRQINLHQLNAANGSSTYFPVSIVHVLNYSSSNMYKVVLNSGGVTDETYLATGTWRNTAPITSMTLWPGYNGSGYIFYAGTSIAVYGTGSATASTKATGGAIYSDANYMYHVFTSSGTFTPSQNLSCDYVVVAGGGSGAWGGSGGGAGGLRSSITTTGGGGTLESALSLTSGTSYTVTVGAGGAGVNGSVASPRNGLAGSNSVFSTITSLGGGYGGGADGGNGGNGGSGGGSNDSGTTAGTGASGQGYRGGYGGSRPAGESYAVRGAGGGGAGAVGANGIDATSTGGNGGIGVTIPTIVSATGIGASGYLAGGGGGGVAAPSGGTAGNGGLGGGGKGAVSYSTTVNASPGLANTGGGGGGAGGGGSSVSGAGGSGIVIVRYAK